MFSEGEEKDPIPELPNRLELCLLLAEIRLAVARYTWLCAIERC
jgi:hypothetical protein